MYNYDRRAAESAEALAEKAEEASAKAIHWGTSSKSALHLEAGRLHWKAAQAFKHEGNAEEAKHHEQLAREHKKDMLEQAAEEIATKHRGRHHSLSPDPGPITPKEVQQEIAEETAKSQKQLSHLIGFLEPALTSC